MAELSRQILSLCQMGAGRDAGRGLGLEVERAQFCVRVELKLCIWSLDEPEPNKISLEPASSF